MKIKMNCAIIDKGNARSTHIIIIRFLSKVKCGRAFDNDIRKAVRCPDCVYVTYIHTNNGYDPMHF